MKEEKLGGKKAKPVERFYIKYDPKNNLPTHEPILPKYIEKKVKAFSSSVFITNDANQNLTNSQKELL